jgi:predicted enzyme related to lactoylglutathione lyase
MSTFVWHDLMTTDAASTQRFYGELLGWRFEALSLGRFTIWQIVAGEAWIGTIMPEASLPESHWMPYFSADDVDATCARVEELGGAVCTRADVPPLGRFAVAGDPQGGWFSLLGRGAAARPREDRGPGRFGWDELATSDPRAAAVFYTGLFGWTCAPKNDDFVIRRGGFAIGAVRAQRAVTRPAWIPSILVEDPPAAEVRAIALGARSVGRGVLVDPSGARFALRATAL